MFNLVLVDAVSRPGGTGAPCLVPDLLVSRQCILADVASLVIQVDADGLMANLPRANAEMDQPLAQLAIFATPFHPFVETIHGDEVRLPTRAIVSIPAWLGGGQSIEQPR